MKDKVIVITGASMGIGAAVAATCVRRGAKVVLAARGVANLSAVAEPLGDSALTVPADVTKRADNELIRDRAIAKFGGIDVWINNAGRGISRMVSELTDDDIDQMVTVNVKSIVYGIQAVLPHFKQRKAGQIITVSSGLSRFPFAPQRSAYSASKAAANLIMASLRVELRDQFPDIHATTVMPGVVATEFGNNALHGGIDNKRMPGAQPVDEVAQVIADVIEKPRAEIYTRPQMLELASRYFSAEDVATIEAGFGGPPR
ncbi:MAG: SDR family NAD(P)-dependent oxidoreductase [Kofleriaceae bacterium]|nr:SDR family NAD(P)-dependent oxidoreductase [Kofleriaceae bacterium]